MFFVIQPALPRDRVFCGYKVNASIGNFTPVFSNTTGGCAIMYETKDEAQEVADQFPGTAVYELTISD